MKKNIVQESLDDLEVESRITTNSLEEVLHNSMIPYTECVVLDRALPRVEDGLKPVQRRILYSMMELGLEPDKPFRKSARIVGDCMGKYHPHGDSSVYDAMVRMAQPFNMGETLVLGHGNFGSIDGDSAAAMRYTEAKMTPLALEMLRDLDKNTVKFSFNFDDTLKEPDMLPARFPNLLVNGSSGIGVGIATNIPTHNLGEVIDGVVAYIEKPSISLEEMMKYIKAPDFPTGGNLIIGDDLVNAYKTGKGKLYIRAKLFVENLKNEQKNIVITELPFQVNKAKLLQRIAELKENNKDVLQDIKDIRDESDRNGMRAIIRVRKECNVEKLIEYLYKYSDLQISFPINMVAIAGGKPKQLGLLEIISYYTEYQRNIIYRRTKYDLDNAKDRLHIVEGLLIAIKNIDEVIKIIKSSSSTVEAKQSLRAKFNLSEKQAQAILDMRLARLTNLEVYKLEEEKQSLIKLIAELTEIYNSKKMQLNIVKKEILEIKKKYATPRKSEILGDVDINNGKVDPKKDLISNKTVVVLLNANGCVKSMGESTFNLSLKTISSNSSLNECHNQILKINNEDVVLLFTNKGNCLKAKAEKLPICKWKDVGQAPKDFNPSLSKEEKFISVIKFDEYKKEKELLFFTKLGMVKKTKFNEFLIKSNSFESMKLREEDEIITILFDEGENLLFVTKDGICLRADKTDVPLQGRISGGVRGINLSDGDYVILATVCEEAGEIFVATSKGYGKTVDISMFDVLPRYRKGVKIITMQEKDKLIFATIICNNLNIVINVNNTLENVDLDKVVKEDRTTKGKLIKSNISSVLVYKK